MSKKLKNDLIELVFRKEKPSKSDIYTLMAEHINELDVDQLDALIRLHIGIKDE